MKKFVKELNKGSTPTNSIIVTDYYMDGVNYQPSVSVLVEGNYPYVTINQEVLYSQSQVKEFVEILTSVYDDFENLKEPLQNPMAEKTKEAKEVIEVIEEEPLPEDGDDIIYKTKCKICGCDVDFTKENSIGYMKSSKCTTYEPIEDEDCPVRDIRSEITINFPDQLEICLDCYRKELDLLEMHIYATYLILGTGKGSHDDVMQPIRVGEKNES